MGKPGQKLAKAHRSISLRIPGPARISSGNRPTIAIAHQQKRNDRPMTGHLLEELNPGQAKAVAHLDGPAVILAGPGAGKTKTLTRRAAMLVQNGVPPEKILLLTFSRASSKEMLARAKRSEEHTSELQSLMRISYAVFCLKKKKIIVIKHTNSN